MASSNHPAPPADAGSLCIQFDTDEVEAHYTTYFKSRVMWDEQGFDYLEVTDEDGFESRIL